MHPRLRRELGRIRLTPRADHVLAERDPTHVHRGQRPELLPTPELRTERHRITLPVERLGSITTSLSPADPPAHRPARQDALLDLHPVQDVTTVGAYPRTVSYRPSPDVVLEIKQEEELIVPLLEIDSPTGP